MSFADQSIAHFDTTTQTMRWLQGTGLGLAAALLIGLGLWIRRSVWSDVRGEPLVAARAACNVAQGNLSFSIPLLSGDQRSIVAALKEMQTRLAALVDRAGTTMTEMVRSIRNVTDTMAEINASSRGQASGFAQVGGAMTQMDQANELVQIVAI